MRIASDDALVQILKDANYPTEYRRFDDGTDDHTGIVVEFPIETNGDTILARDMSAVDQLELAKKLQTLWADNSISITVYYHPEELDEIKEWMKKNYEKSLKTVSFLLHANHGFDQPPYEEISQEEYEKRIARLKPVMGVATGETLVDLECVGGACPIR
jgi:ribonucleoside-diphosphate reductase alpha chain/ribonucleoside-triphosphate reductase